MDDPSHIAIYCLVVFVCVLCVLLFFVIDERKALMRIAGCDTEHAQLANWPPFFSYFPIVCARGFADWGRHEKDVGTSISIFAVGCSHSRGR